MTMEEDELTLVERHIAIGHIAPGSVGRTGDIASEPLGGSLLLVVEHLHILCFANEQSLGLVNHDHINGIGVRGSIISQGNLEWFRKVALRATGWTACGILAALHFEGGVGKIHAAVGSHRDSHGLVGLVDGTLHSFQEEEGHDGLVVAHSHLIVHYEIAIGNMQGLISSQVDMIANFEITFCTSRNGEAGNLHVVLCSKVNRHLHLNESFLRINSGWILSVKHKFPNQTLSADIDTARTVVVRACCKAANNADETYDV